MGQRENAWFYVLSKQLLFPKCPVGGARVSEKGSFEVTQVNSFIHAQLKVNPNPRFQRYHLWRWQVRQGSPEMWHGVLEVVAAEES